jgi:flagellar biosynthesis chaperone FliJ
MSARFRLGVVLRLRQLAEDAARAELGRALGGHRDAIDAAGIAHGRAAAMQAELAGIQEQPSPVAGELRRTADLADRAGEQVTTALALVEHCAEALLAARARLAEASRQRDVVERLRDRLTTANALAAARRSDAEMSEIAMQTHAGRRRAEEVR